VEAVIAGRSAGALRRAVYHEVTSEVGKNLRECVIRIDDADKVPPDSNAKRAGHGN
jgi:hypothetical protein